MRTSVRHRIAVRKVAVAVTLLAILNTSTGTVMAADPTTDQPLAVAPASAPSPDADADAFRAEVGFAPASVALAATAPSPTSVQAWGIPLTPAEEAELNARSMLQEDLTDAHVIVEANADRTGGAWLDQRAGNGNGFVF